MKRCQGCPGCVLSRSPSGGGTGNGCSHIGCGEGSWRMEEGLAYRWEAKERRGKDSGPGEAAGREQGGEGVLGAGGLFEGLREAGEDGERRRVPRARTWSPSSLPYSKSPSPGGGGREGQPVSHSAQLGLDSCANRLRKGLPGHTSGPLSSPPPPSWRLPPSSFLAGCFCSP